MTTIYLPNELGKQLRRGHPWVYRNRLAKPPSLPSGTWVQVQCGTWHGYGLWDAHSPIAVRIFSQQRMPDAEWIKEAIQIAWRVREPVRGAETTAYRWLYGEGDSIPGVVVDLYNDYAVIGTYAESLDALLGWLVDGLRACVPLKGIVLRRGGGDAQVLWGRRPSPNLIIVENGLRMHVDLMAGQKTGLFLDHRENRQYLEGWCANKQVLNCFAYTGAFSLYAVRGGATQVLSADIAPQTAEETRHNLSINGYDPDAHPFVIADCFELLESYAEQDRRFDLIILDPPSLAHAKKSRYAALRAYTRINHAALRCLSPGGLLATASCTSQVYPQAFRDMLGRAASLAGKRLIILHEAGHAIDHPVPAHFVEGRYLKFVLGRVQRVL